MLSPALRPKKLQPSLQLCMQLERSAIEQHAMYVVDGHSNGTRMAVLSATAKSRRLRDEGGADLPNTVRCANRIDARALQASTHGLRRHSCATRIAPAPHESHAAILSASRTLKPLELARMKTAFLSLAAWIGVCLLSAYAAASHMYSF